MGTKDKQSVGEDAAEDLRSFINTMKETLAANNSKKY
jgi:hypothetical protein